MPSTPKPRRNKEADGHVDLLDFGQFSVCFGQDDSAPLTADCLCADIDNDGDVDLQDFSQFSLLFSGS